MRIIEILIAINALCGIAAFLVARGLWKKFENRMRKVLGDDNDDQHLPPPQRRLGS